MITKVAVMPLLLDACPSFLAVWNSYVNDATYEPGLLYVDLAEFARHLVHLVQAGSIEEFPSVFAVVERLHTEGDGLVKEAATIGLLEGIQNAADHAGIPAKTLVPYLGPVSALWWQEVEQFWDGKIPLVGSGVKSES